MRTRVRFPPSPLSSLSRWPKRPPHPPVWRLFACPRTAPNALAPQWSLVGGIQGVCPSWWSLAEISRVKWTGERRLRQRIVGSGARGTYRGGV